VVLLGKNRDRVSIVAAILETANSGASKTRIMFGANLSFKLLEKYLGVVVDAGFVRVVGSRFVLTEYGHEFLRQYRQFLERYVVAQHSLEALSCEREKLDLMCMGSLGSAKLRSSNSFLQA
jgi:predicted transcriptional regulator